MRLLQGYIGRAVIMAALAVLGVIIALDCLFSFIAELEGLRGNYQALQALQFVFTTVPRRFHEYMPLAILLGTLIGLGVLANSGELTVIRAAGVSVGRVSWMVLRPVLLLLVIGMSVGEFISPYTEQMAQSNRAIAEGKGEALSSRYGFWHREGDEFIHVNVVQPNGVLYGVTRYRFNEDRTLAEAQFVERAIYQDEGYWFLEGVRGSALEPDRVEAYQRDTDRWDTSLTPQLLALVVLDPERLAMRKLVEYSGYLSRQGLEAGEYLLSFWQKLFQPLATLGMVLIAISFIFGPLREVTMGLRLTAGIVAGMLFFYGQQFIGHLSLVFHVSPLMAALVPPLLCLVVGTVLLKRVR